MTACLTIPAGCRCTWLLAGTDPPAWTLADTDTGCKVHGGGSDETAGESA